LVFVPMLLLLLTAACGTNRKCQRASALSALGGNPDGICSLRAFSFLYSDIGPHAAKRRQLDSERTAPVKANQSLAVATPPSRHHWAAKAISASGKPYDHMSDDYEPIYSEDLVWRGLEVA